MYNVGEIDRFIHALRQQRTEITGQHAIGFAAIDKLPPFEQMQTVEQQTWWLDQWICPARQVMN